MRAVRDVMNIISYLQSLTPCVYPVVLYLLMDRMIQISRTMSTGKIISTLSMEIILPIIIIIILGVVVKDISARVARLNGRNIPQTISEKLRRFMQMLRSVTHRYRWKLLRILLKVWLYLGTNRSESDLSRTPIKKIPSDF